MSTEIKETRLYDIVFSCCREPWQRLLIYYLLLLVHVSQLPVKGERSGSYIALRTW